MEVRRSAITSHSIGIPELTHLLEVMPPQATLDDYERAAVEGNALALATESGREWRFATLRRLYLLRPTSVLFRALREPWAVAEDGRMEILDEAIEGLKGSIFGGYVYVVGHVVTEVFLWRRIERRQPDGINTENLGQIRELFPDPLQVTDSVPGRVRKRPRVNLIDDPGPPGGPPIVASRSAVSIAIRSHGRTDWLVSNPTDTSPPVASRTVGRQGRKKTWRKLSPGR